MDEKDRDKQIEEGLANNGKPRLVMAEYLLNNLPDEVCPTATKALDFEVVELHRNLDCPYYSKCVTISAYRSWNSFTCVACSLSEKEKEE